jgi:hypothetical protein
MPAMKAIYRDAGMKFPDIDTTDEVQTDEVKLRTEVAKKKARQLLNKEKYNGKARNN